MYLGIDCGTQGTKALILDIHSGKVLGEGSAAHRILLVAQPRQLVQRLVQGGGVADQRRAAVGVMRRF